MKMGERIHGCLNIPPTKEHLSVFCNVVSCQKRATWRHSALSCVIDAVHMQQTNTSFTCNNSYSKNILYLE